MAATLEKRGATYEYDYAYSDSWNPGIMDQAEKGAATNDYDYAYYETEKNTNVAVDQADDSDTRPKCPGNLKFIYVYVSKDISH